ncbi:unnamed protein product [Ceratitis capitata]|uniref:(Mediterranean fruit fly) hypothetical protein n=1 Tax=Ceratitis capitata TaxID=7213 RepID=A0A811V7B8_CERCA|nr:unnamed protein product [Ceratitis capitata]
MWHKCHLKHMLRVARAVERAMTPPNANKGHNERPCTYVNGKYKCLPVCRYFIVVVCVLISTLWKKNQSQSASNSSYSCLPLVGLRRSLASSIAELKNCRAEELTCDQAALAALAGWLACLLMVVAAAALLNSTQLCFCFCFCFCSDVGQQSWWWKPAVGSWHTWRWWLFDTKNKYQHRRRCCLMMMTLVRYC